MRILSYDGKIYFFVTYQNRSFLIRNNKFMKKSAKNSKNKFKSKNDPLGSYTGNCLVEETPIQDADDL